MSTHPYCTTKLHAGTVHGREEWPIVMYAKSIKKNTADFTSADLRAFLRWSWRVEPIKRGVCQLPSHTSWYGNKMTTPKGGPDE